MTILGRSGQGTGRNDRVAARYANGVETGSSSTFRAFDMQNGNTTQDSFSGIVAPDGFWITSIAMNSDSGVFAALDDLAFITSDVIPVAPEIAAGLQPAYAPYLGDTLALGVTLAPGASPPPTYQWYLDDVEINPFFPRLRSAPGSFKGLHPKRNFLAISARKSPSLRGITAFSPDTSSTQ